MAIAAHDQLVADNAMWIARATVLANQQTVQPFRDTEASRERAAKAAAVKRKLKADQLKTSQVESQTAVASTKVREPRQGGHTIASHGQRWWCTVCRCKSSTRENLEPKLCKGSAVMKWRLRARFVASRNLPEQRVSGVIKAVTKLDETKPHAIVVSGSLFWCTVWCLCGVCPQSA